MKEKLSPAYDWHIMLRDDDFEPIGHDRILTQAQAGDCFRNKEYLYHLRVCSVDGNQMSIERSWQ